MKYILFILALVIAVNVNAQTDVQHTTHGASYRVFTHNTGDKIKVNDVITFDFIQKTDKDSVLMSSFVTGNKGKAQVLAIDGIKDIAEINLMEVFPKLALNDSAEVKIPTDSVFKGHDAQRPAFFPKGSNLVFVLKIEKIQSLNDAIAERNAEMEKVKAEEAKIQAKEAVTAANYIASHKLVLKTTATGLKYLITKPSLKPKPLKGDTVLVNYTCRGLDGKVYDSSVESVAKASGLNQPGRTYEPYQLEVGAGGVIPGWDEGLLLLNEGSKAMFVIPSSLAYGAQGSGEIGPYSTLVFDIELVKVKPIKHPVVAKPAVKKPVHKKYPAKKKS
jgi:FKBP-type peptidyl-prolyl cis-trans isomerase FkpA